eukprot:763974-Hanusia_phi.AAC.2
MVSQQVYEICRSKGEELGAYLLKPSKERRIIKCPLRCVLIVPPGNRQRRCDCQPGYVSNQKTPTSTSTSFDAPQSPLNDRTRKLAISPSRRRSNRVS